MAWRRASSRARRRRIGLSVLVGLVGMGAGCLGADFDSPQEVKDLRVLAIRLDPPEVELPLDPAAAPAEVQVEVLVADPARGEVHLEVRGCRHAAARGCEAVAEGEPSLEPLEALLVAQLTLPAAPEPPAAVHRETRTLPAETLQALVFPPGGGVSLAGARPVFEVFAAGAGGEEVAFKRLQIGFPDVLFRAILDEAGLSICDAQGLPDGCVPYRTRRPNENPVLEGLEYRLETEDDEAFRPVPAAAPLRVASGAPVVLRPEVASGSAEAYQTVAIDFETRTVHLEDREEFLVFSWYATGGRLDFGETEAERTLGIENRWVAPSAASMAAVCPPAPKVASTYVPPGRTARCASASASSTGRCAAPS